MAELASRQERRTSHHIEERISLTSDTGSVRTHHSIREIESAVGVLDIDDYTTSVSWLYALSSTLGARSSLPRLVYVHVTKRLLDLCIALSACLVVLPLLVIIAVAIRLSTRGPILYQQTRIGRGGRPFTVYKFRTMVDDRRQRLEVISFPDRRKRHKSERDPRVTRIGQLLRRTSLDELPQLINVLRGEMSLVGPRPELPTIVANYQDWQHLRHLVRPGITGWWQVNGRSDRPMHENTELDIEYVQRVSLWMDLTIILRTVRVVLLGRGAF